MPNQMIRRLERLGPLSEEERGLVEAAARNRRTVGPNQDLARQGDRPMQCCVLLEGFAARYKILPNGKRQILSIHLAGDWCDVQAVLLKTLDHGLGTLTRCNVAFVPHETILAWIEAYPRLRLALWHDALSDAAMFREWIVNLGARSAYERLAHTLCEISFRLNERGLGNGDRYSVPLTQSQLGDVLGTSLVHVNRVLQELRRAGLISFKAGVLVINDWDGLVDAAQFDPTYLLLPVPEKP